MKRKTEHIKILEETKGDDGYVFVVKSNGSDQVHEVVFSPDNCYCTCYGFFFRKSLCKHMKKALEHIRKKYGGEAEEEVLKWLLNSPLKL